MTTKQGFPEELPRPLVIRRGRLTVTYRSRWRTLLATVLVVAAVITAGVLTGLLLAATLVSAVIVLFWAVMTARILRGIPLPYGGGGGAPPPPDGDGVREPRGPKPLSPAGAAALPLPDTDDPPAVRLRKG